MIALLSTIFGTTGSVISDGIDVISKKTDDREDNDGGGVADTFVGLAIGEIGGDADENADRQAGVALRDGLGVWASSIPGVAQIFGGSKILEGGIELFRGDIMDALFDFSIGVSSLTNIPGVSALVVSTKAFFQNAFKFGTEGAKLSANVAKSQAAFKGAMASKNSIPLLEKNMAVFAKAKDALVKKQAAHATKIKELMTQKKRVSFWNIAEKRRLGAEISKLKGEMNGMTLAVERFTKNYAANASKIKEVSKIEVSPYLKDYAKHKKEYTSFVANRNATMAKHGQEIMGTVGQASGSFYNNYLAWMWKPFKTGFTSAPRPSAMGAI